MPRIIPFNPVYLVWRDHVGMSGLSFSEETLRPVVLHGVTNLVEETEDALVVSHFVGSQEYCTFDQTVIAKESIIARTTLPYLRVDLTLAGKE